MRQSGRRVGVGPGVAEPTPGEELSVGEALTKKRQDLAEFMGCSVDVLDDLEAVTAGEKVSGTADTQTSGR